MNPMPMFRKAAALLAMAGAGLCFVSLVDPAPARAQAPAPAAAAPAPAAAAPAAIVGDPARGLLKAATCLGCHAIPGYKADFPVVYSVPMIGGQNAKYIESALKDYQKGARRFPSMIATARSLSDQDIADVAAYFSSQR
jgi:cytochrome c553